MYMKRAAEKNLGKFESKINAQGIMQDFKVEPVLKVDETEST